MLTFSGSMTLSAGKAYMGMKMRSSVRSSTSVQGVLHYKGSELFEFEFGFPKHHQELIDFR